MKARIHDYGGTLKIEVCPENNDERMLLRAFLREHDDPAFHAWVTVESSSPIVTFGRPNHDTSEVP
jgi:hypothetical protein